MSDRHIMREDISNSVARIPAGVPALTPIDSHSHQHSPFTYNMKLFIVSSLPNKNSLGCEPNHPSCSRHDKLEIPNFLLTAGASCKHFERTAKFRGGIKQKSSVLNRSHRVLAGALSVTSGSVSYQCLKVTFPNSQIISKRCEHSTSSTHFNPRFTFKILERFSCELCECVNEIRPLRHFLPPPPGHS